MGAEWEERGGGEGEGRPPHWSLARWRPMGRPRSALVTWRAHKSFAPLFSPPFSFFFFAFLLLFFFSLSLSLSLSGSSLSSGVSTDSSFVSPFVLFLLLFSFFRFFLAPRLRVVAVVVLLDAAGNLFVARSLLSVPFLRSF